MSACLPAPGFLQSSLYGPWIPEVPVPPEAWQIPRGMDQAAPGHHPTPLAKVAEGKPKEYC